MRRSVACLALAVAASLCVGAPSALAVPGFTFSARGLSDAQRQRMTGVSWHEGCPVGLDDLRDLRVAHWDFRGRRRVGELVVNRDAVAAMRTAFAALYAGRFPIRRMRPVDAYRGDDYASIEADNTSAFNCRAATGSTHWSQHAYGRAIDVNPIENPYVYANGTTTHAASRPYLDRSRVRPGMAVAGGPLVRAFAGVGWGWGGSWSPPRDLQHFSATGR
jgi:D-alanyl-D-alanine carboxypeptidase-like protein